MKSKFNKFLSVLITLCMVVSMLPGVSLTASANENAYITFSSPSAFTLAVANATKNWDGTLEYSTDLLVWTEWDGTTALTSSASGKLYLRGSSNTKISGSVYNTSCGWILTPSAEGNGISCSGDIMTLLDYQDPPEEITASYAFANLFRDCASLTSAPELSAATLASYCYSKMFLRCTSLTSTPELPATILASYCYKEMFFGCTGLTSVPLLPATILKSNCYESMFSSCRNIKLYEDGTGEPWSIPTGATTASNWNKNMFNYTGGSFNGGPSVGTPYYYVPAEYDLWVGGVRVTCANAGNVFNDYTVSFDAGTSTLYLKNANITSDNAPAIKSELDTLYINITGDNTISISGTQDSGIYSTGNLVFIGDGMLNTTVTGSASYDPINADGTITFGKADDPSAFTGTVIATVAENVTQSAQAIRGAGGIKIYNGFVKAVNNYTGCYAFDTNGNPITVYGGGLAARGTASAFMANTLVKVENTYRYKTSPDGEEVLAFADAESMPREGTYYELEVDTTYHANHEGWTEWTFESGNAESGKYFLNADITATDCIGIQSGETVTLCLNGHTLDMQSFYLRVSNGATLNICDCGEEETWGKITSACNGNYDGTITSAGTVNVFGGEIENTFFDETYGRAAVYLGAYVINRFTLDGGKITSSNGTGINMGGSSDTYTYIKDGEINAKCGVFNYCGNLYINGGTITSADDVAVEAYGITYLYGEPVISGGRYDLGICYTEEVFATYGDTEYSGDELSVYYYRTDIGDVIVCDVTDNNGKLFRLVNEGYRLIRGSGENENNLVVALSHVHSWGYTAASDTITAVCSGDSPCDYNGTDTTLSIIAPEMTSYGDGKRAYATLSSTSLSGIDPIPAIKYVGRGDTSYSESEVAPTEVGTYAAKLAVGDAVASVDYEISQQISGGGGGTTRYTVKFDTDGGSAIKNASVTRNSKVTEPDEPTKDGFVFDGWYTDKDLTEKYDFEAPVTKSFTLYASWSEIIVEPDPDIEKPGTDISELKWNPFIDVNENDWFHDIIKEAYLNGLVTGTTDTTFTPDGNITRGMFVTILYRAEGEPAAPKLNFTDVASDWYYCDAIAWANANGIVRGISENEFAPNANITREQMAAILYRYAQFKKYDVSIGEDTNILSYADFDKISEYAVSSMQWACGDKIINGKGNGILDPTGFATRAEAATMLIRLLGKMQIAKEEK